MYIKGEGRNGLIFWCTIITAQEPVVFSEVLGCGVLEMSLTKQLLPVA